MKAYFNLNADFDLRMIPYSPACESDELEIRAQAYNAGSGEASAKQYEDYVAYMKTQESL